MSVRRTALPAVIRVGGREFPVVTVPQCLTCQSEQRGEIEQHIVAGRPWAMIAERLVPEAGLRAVNIKSHVDNGHMPAAQIERLSTVAQRYDELGKSIAERDQLRHDEVLLARLTVQEGVRGLLAGTTMPTITEALAAGKFLREVQAGATQMDMDLVSQAFREVLGVVEDEVPSEFYQRVLDRLRSNPVLEALDEEWKRRKEERGAEAAT